MATKFDPENPALLKKLCAAVDYSKRQKKPFEEFRLELYRRITGPHYGDNEGRENRPINRLEFQSSVFLRGISSHNVQSRVETHYQELRPHAADLELALNQELGRIRAGDSFNMCALEAIVSMGVMEVGITSKNTPPDGEGNLYDPGHIFADPVLFEDLILDMAAKHWDQQSYVGHDFIVPFEWVKENRNFDKEARDKLVSPDREWYGDDTRSEELSWSGGEVEEFEDTMRLRQLFLPRQKLVLIFAVGSEKIQHPTPLQIIKWEGPERGPYHPLAFIKLPGNLIPLPPAINWFDLDDVINKNFRRAADQAESQKDIVFASPNNIADAEAVRDARDGDIIAVQDPKSVLPASFGGANEKNLAIVMWAKDVLNEISGNPDMLGGVGPQSATVGQDQLIAQNASGRLKDMQQSMLDFQSRVIQDLARWIWEDPLSEIRFTKQVGNTGYGIPVVWGPESRMGRFFDYNIYACPYSSVKRSPSEQGAFLLELLNTFVLPSLQFSQAQGKGLNWESVYKDIAKLNNVPELSYWIEHLSGEQVPQREPVSGKPAQTKRTYERINRPAATQQGKQQVLMRSLMGQDSQPAEMAALMRPAG